MELKWEKTTFGELKAGDYWRVVDDNDSPFMCVRIMNQDSRCLFDDCEVLRLVTPEREALESISADDLKAMRTLWDNREAIREKLEALLEYQRGWVPARQYEQDIAESALALLEKGGEG